MPRLILPPDLPIAAAPADYLQAGAFPSDEPSWIQLLTELLKRGVLGWLTGGVTLALTTVALFYWGAFYFGGLFFEFGVRATALDVPIWVVLTGGSGAAAQVVLTLVVVAAILGFHEGFRYGTNFAKIAGLRRGY